MSDEALLSDAISKDLERIVARVSCYPTQAAGDIRYLLALIGRLQKKYAEATSPVSRGREF